MNGVSVPAGSGGKGARWEGETADAEIIQRRDEDEREEIVGDIGEKRPRHFPGR